MTQQIRSTEDMSPHMRMRRERLLDAAAKAIAQDGYTQVRLRDVAAVSGVTTGAVQYHFESREALLNEAFSRSTLEQIKRWRQVASDESDPGARLYLLLECMMEEFSSPQICTIWVELCLAAARYPALRELKNEVYEQWHQILGAAASAAVAAGTVVATMPVERAISLLLATFDGFELDLVSTLGSVTPELAAEHMNHLVDLLFPPKHLVK